MTTRDMTFPNWARRVKRLRGYAEVLKAHDFQVAEPDGLEVPPPYRNGQSSVIVEVSRMGVEDDEVSTPDRPEN